MSLDLRGIKMNVASPCATQVNVPLYLPGKFVQRLSFYLPTGVNDCLFNYLVELGKRDSLDLLTLAQCISISRESELNMPLYICR